MTTQLEPRIVLPRVTEGGAIGAGLAVIRGTAEHQVKLPTAAGQPAEGITATSEGNAAGKPVPVIAFGFARAISAAAIAQRAPVKINGVTGKLDTAAPAAGANADIVGWAWTATSGADEEFDLFVLPGRIQG